jgi:hypothetical protein
VISPPAPSLPPLVPPASLHPGTSHSALPPISFRFTFLDDPHPLNPIESHSSKKRRGGGSRSRPSPSAFFHRPAPCVADAHVQTQSAHAFTSLFPVYPGVHPSERLANRSSSRSPRPIHSPPFVTSLLPFFIASRCANTARTRRAQHYSLFATRYSLPLSPCLPRGVALPYSRLPR